MIAVVDLHAKAVWGIGTTAAEAMRDAKYQMSRKPNLKVGKLDYAQLSDDADLDADGETLFQYSNYTWHTQNGNRCVK